MPQSATHLASKQRILTDLQASSALTGVLVTWNRPNWAHGESEVVAVTDIASSLTWSNMGRYRREEQYVIKVECDVYRGGSDAQGTETRLDALMGAVQQAILADYQLGGTVEWALVNHIQSTVTASGDGYLAHGEVDVDVLNRIA